MAAEFAVLFPALVGTLLGIIWASLLAYSAASLHYAVEGAASSCGHQVSATVNVAFSLALASWKVPLSATACFP